MTAAGYRHGLTNDGTCDAHPVTDEPFIDVRETHTAVVVLAGDRAFKPVVTDFCDFHGGTA